MTWGKWCFKEGKYTQRDFDVTWTVEKLWTLIFKNKSIKEIKHTKIKSNSHKTRNFFKSILLHSNWYITLKRGIINLLVRGYSEFVVCFFSGARYFQSLIFFLLKIWLWTCFPKGVRTSNEFAQKSIFYLKIGLILLGRKHQTIWFEYANKNLKFWDY